MKKFIALALALVLAVSTLVGCGGTPAADNNGESADKPVKIGVAMATTQSTFYAKMAKIIEDYCKEQGIDCTISDPNYDLAKQVEQVENFIASGCTAIVVVAFDPEGINDVCQ